MNILGEFTWLCYWNLAAGETKGLRGALQDHVSWQRFQVSLENQLKDLDKYSEVQQQVYHCYTISLFNFKSFF